MFDVCAPLVARRQLANEMWVLAFEAPAIAESVRGGQFVNLLLRPGPLLRRPFSVYRADTDRGLIEVVLRAVGEGTGRLLALREGDLVSALGPLGSGFELNASMGRVALISGGLGVAPMPLTARDAQALGVQVTWVHGARTGEDLCPEWNGDKVYWATEDGSLGIEGTALDAAGDDPGGPVLACGPNRMLAAVAARWPEAQVALETYMGCGTGVCLGCAVPRTSGVYDRACSEGPVYRADSIRWPELPSHLPYSQPS